MFKRQSIMRSAVLAVAGIVFFTIAAGATSAGGFSVVDSVKQFLGLAPQPDVKARPVDRPDSLLLTDDFAYAANSALNGQGGWTAHSAPGTNPITVTSPGLTYPGYVGSGVGNAVSLGTTGEDDNVGFAGQTSGAVYAAAMVNVSSAQVTGDYFLHFFDGAISGNIFRGRVFIKKDPTNATYGFGIQFGSTVNTVYTPTTFVTGATHLLVVKYTFVDGANNDTVSLFVDPPLGGAEPAPTLTNSDTSQADAISLDGIALRQGSSANAATETVDGIRVGTAWADVAGGGGGGTPSPSPTQSPSTPSPTPTPSPSATPSPVASPSPTVPPVPFTAGNVVLYRVGYGNEALSNVATVVFLDEYTPLGTYVQSIRMPVDVIGGNHILTATGTSSAEGLMTRSTDGNYLVLTGYDKAPGGANPSADPPTTTNRVVGRVAASASIDTTTALNDPTGNIRSSASTNGTDLWLTTSSNGSRYTTLGMMTSTQLATTPTNLRATTIFNGQLYVSSATGAFQGISTVGTGLPMTGGQTITLLNGFPTTSGPSPMQFAFFDANTLYVADDRTPANGGGIQKWVQSGGTWTLASTLNNGLTAGIRGLTLTGNATAFIWASTADNPSKLVMVTDDGTPSPMFTTLATTAANTAWRSVAFAPSGGPNPTPTPVTPTPTPPRTPTPTPSPSPSPSPSGRVIRSDFDGDHKTDLSVFRPSDGNWYRLNSSDGQFVAVNFGLEGDIITPGDFDGDGLTDIAVFRPSSGAWFRLNSSNGTFVAVAFGTNGDKPAAGDYDGDHLADVCVWRPSDGNWYRLNSSNGQFVATNFGLNGDKPVAGDYDGDGRYDVSVFRPSDGVWYRLNSSNGNFSAVQFGISSDMPTPADYDGDGRDDIAVWRPSNGVWYRLNSSNGAFAAVQFGASGDQPAPGDYDGDGFYDQAVYRDGDWFLLRSTQGFTGAPFGTTGDRPTPAGYIP